MQGFIFTGGQGPKPQIIKRLLEIESSHQRLEDALFFAADSGLIAAENAGVKPDWIIGDMDSLDDTSRLGAFPPERIVHLNHNKDFTDTEVAFSLAVESGCKNIWIIGGGGGRIDHIFGIRSLFERELFPYRWITDAEDIYCIDANEGNHKICMNLDEDTIVSVFPLGAGPWEAFSSGLKWPLAGLPWNRGFFGLSNVVMDGGFSIKAEQGRFMVILPCNTIELES